MGRILVIGANGTVGSGIVRELQAQNETTLKATSREPKSSNEVKLNLITGEGLDSVRSVEQLFLLSPPGHVNQDQLLIPLIERAKAAGLQKVVLMTAMGVDAAPDAPLRKVELALEQSGLPYNIVRPNWFMQNFNSYWVWAIKTLNQIRLPVESAKGSFIDARDISSVAARLLTTDVHTNQTFDLTGAQALDHNDVARILSVATDRTIQYVSISKEEMHKNLIGAGLPESYAQFMLFILEAFRLGYSARTTSAVQTILGREPISFERYAKDYRNEF